MMIKIRHITWHRQMTDSMKTPVSLFTSSLENRIVISRLNACGINNLFVCKRKVMNKKQIEVNSDFNSIAASWLGVDLADLKTENRADLDDAQKNTCFLNSKSKVKTISFHTEKLDDIQTVFPKAKTKNGFDSTANFVGGKIQRKLQKAKRRKDEAKDEDNTHSSIRQEQYFDEDSKASAIQSKSKTLRKPQNMDLHNSEENIRRLLAATKDKNTKKKLRRKLKKLAKKSCGSISSENESNMPSHMSVETTQLLEPAVTNTSKKKKKTPISPISDTNVSRTEPENNDQALIVSKKTSVGNHIKHGSKKTKKQKHGIHVDKDKYSDSMDFDSSDGQISCKDDEMMIKTPMHDKSSSPTEEGIGKKFKKIKKKINNETMDACFETKFLKIDKYLMQTKDEILFKPAKKKKVTMLSDLSGKKNLKELKRKQEVCDDGDGVSRIKVKKNDKPINQTSELTMDTGHGAGSTDKSNDEEARKDRPFKRKRKKKRSKQKNIKKDHRPDHMKPPHLRAKALGAAAVEKKEH